MPASRSTICSRDGALEAAHVQQPLPKRQREAFPRARTAAASRFHLLGNSLQQMQCNYQH